MKAPVILKKYGNRRLYDTRRSGYVTLAEVEELLQAGDDVQIIDAKTNDDLTKSVLVQIILEREETREALPTAFLKQVVRLGNSPLKETFSRQLGGFLQGFVDAQRSFVQAQRELGEQMTKMAPYNPFSMLTNPFAAFSPPPSRSAAVDTPPPAPPRDDGDLRDLREQLHETQALVRQLLKKSEEGEPVADPPKRRGSGARAAEEKRRRARR